MISSSKTSQRSVQLVEPLIGNEEIEAVCGVLRSGQLAQGPIVADFEREFARVIGVKHAVAVNSGTAAIHCGLEGLGVGAGDEVLTTPFTFAATATPVLMQRGVVRFVDIDEQTFNVDLESFARHVSQRTRAVVGVDLFGLPFRRDGYDELARRSIVVLDDACQGIGARSGAKFVGADCDAAAFSFYATKNVMTGEGGMLTTNSDAVAVSAKRFRQHGQGERYEYLKLGFNYRLTDVLAAIGRVQLGKLDAITAARQANARYYNECLAGIPGVITPFAPKGATHAYHQYSILIDPGSTPNGTGRGDVRTSLAKAGVASGIYYPKPLHLHPLFGGESRRGEFPVSERVASQILALPIHPGLREADLAYVVAAVQAAVGAI